VSSILDQLMITKLPEGTVLRFEVARRGDSHALKVDIVRRLTHNGVPGESSKTVYEETGPERQIISRIHRWVGENMADLNTKRTP
jgi:hypothetical protein